MPIKIGSEDEAWDVLSQLIDGALDIQSIEELEFGDWVKSSVYIPEERYDSALNTYMMQGWQDAQRALYRSYAIAAKGADDARSLTDLEREKLELVVKVKSGSSDQEADLGDILKEAVIAAVGNMEPRQIAVVLIVAILAWTGVTVTRHWLTKRAETKLAEINAGSKRDTDQLIAKAFETVQKVAVDQGRADLIVKATKANPALQTFTEEAEVARHSMVKHSSQSDAVVNGVDIPADVGRNVTRETRTESVDERRDGPIAFKKLIPLLQTGSGFL